MNLTIDELRQRTDSYIDELDILKQEENTLNGQLIEKNNEKINVDEMINSNKQHMSDFDARLELIKGQLSQIRSENPTFLSYENKEKYISLQQELMEIEREKRERINSIKVFENDNKQQEIDLLNVQLENNKNNQEKLLLFLNKIVEICNEKKDDIENRINELKASNIETNQKYEVIKQEKQQLLVRKQELESFIEKNKIFGDLLSNKDLQEIKAAKNELSQINEKISNHINIIEGVQSRAIASDELEQAELQRQLADINNILGSIGSVIVIKDDLGNESVINSSTNEFEQPLVVEPNTNNLFDDNDNVTEFNIDNVLINDENSFEVINNLSKQADQAKDRFMSIIERYNKIDLLNNSNSTFDYKESLSVSELVDKFNELYEELYPLTFRRLGKHGLQHFIDGVEEMDSVVTSIEKEVLSLGDVEKFDSVVTPIEKEVSIDDSQSELDEINHYDDLQDRIEKTLDDMIEFLENILNDRFATVDEGLKFYNSIDKSDDIINALNEYNFVSSFKLIVKAKEVRLEELSSRIGDVLFDFTNEYKEPLDYSIDELLEIMINKRKKTKVSNDEPENDYNFKSNENVVDTSIFEPTMSKFKKGTSVQSLAVSLSLKNKDLTFAVPFMYQSIDENIIFCSNPSKLKASDGYLYDGRTLITPLGEEYSIFPTSQSEDRKGKINNKTNQVKVYLNDKIIEIQSLVKNGMSKQYNMSKILAKRTSLQKASMERMKSLEKAKNDASEKIKQGFNDRQGTINDLHDSELVNMAIAEQLEKNKKENGIINTIKNNSIIGAIKSSKIADFKLISKIKSSISNRVMKVTKTRSEYNEMTDELNQIYNNSTKKGW